MICTNPMKDWLLGSLIALATILMAPSAFAQAVAPLVTFQNGEVADASEVNQNFSALRSAANQNGQAIDSLNGRLSAAESTVAQNENRLQQLSPPFSDSTGVTIDQQCFFGGGPVDGICVPSDEVAVGMDSFGNPIEPVTIPLTELATLSLDATGPGSLSIDLAVAVDFICDSESYCNYGGALLSAWLTTDESPPSTTADASSYCDIYDGGGCITSVDPPLGAIESTEIRASIYASSVNGDREPLRFDSFAQIDVSGPGPIDLNLLVSCPRPVSFEGTSFEDYTCIIDPDRTVIRATFFPEAD